MTKGSGQWRLQMEFYPSRPLPPGTSPTKIDEPYDSEDDARRAGAERRETIFPRGGSIVYHAVIPPEGEPIVIVGRLSGD